MPTPTLKLLYNPGEYIPYPIAPEGVPTIEDTATMEDLSPETKALLERNKQRVEERNQREYEEHRRNTDVRFTGEKPLVPEDWKFAAILTGLRGPIGPTMHLMANPASASTGLGSALLTAGDAAGVAFGVKGMDDLHRKWLSGQFHHSDIPTYLLNTMGTLPALNVLKTMPTTQIVSRTSTFKPTVYDTFEYINNVDDALLERQPLTTNKSKQFWDGTSKSKLTEAEKAGIPKSERNQPIKQQYENLRFIRNLQGLPDMEDGMVLASPKGRYFSNFTTDVPFRTHDSYNYRPGGEFMIVHPDAFKGIKPLTIDPMDTIFFNSDLRIDPKHITILSGNPALLRQAKLKGMNVATTPEIRRLYKLIDGKYKADNLKIFNEDYGKRFKFSKAPKWGDSPYADDFTNAVDDYFTSIGRPKYQAYHDMKKSTGLNAGVSWNPKKMISDFNSIKAKVGKLKRSEIPNGNVFTYPNGKGYDAFSMMNAEVSDFYKNVWYDPIPDTEQMLLLKKGEGFSRLHPFANDVYNDVDNLLKTYQTTIGHLKLGGKLNGNK